MFKTLKSGAWSDYRETEAQMEPVFIINDEAAGVDEGGE